MHLRADKDANGNSVTDKLYFEMTLVFWSKCCNVKKHLVKIMALKIWIFKIVILKLLDVHLFCGVKKYFLISSSIFQ